MTEYTIIRRCSTLCHMNEPCSITESGWCDQSNKPPVDYDALAFEVGVAAVRIAESSQGRSYVSIMAQALRESLP